ncbi:MAG TPA: hypothetical protein VF502_02750 [Stellaceae bacterium]
MTVNERLFEVGRIDQFDEAARQGNRELMIALLVEVEISPQDAAWTADAILAHPTRNGRIKP